MSDKTLRVAEDFTPFPFGRYRSEGEYSGEAFRDDILWPLLSKGQSVEVNLDDVEGGLGSSFLEEVFGGIIRKYGYTPARLKAQVTISSDEDPELVERTWEYVERAYTSQ
jgi:hypothetical protein